MTSALIAVTVWALTFSLHAFSQVSDQATKPPSFYSQYFPELTGNLQSYTRRLYGLIPSSDAHLLAAKKIRFAAQKRAFCNERSILAGLTRGEESETSITVHLCLRSIFQAARTIAAVHLSKPQTIHSLTQQFNDLHWSLFKIGGLASQIDWELFAERKGPYVGCSMNDRLLVAISKLPFEKCINGLTEAEVQSTQPKTSNKEWTTAVTSSFDHFERQVIKDLTDLLVLHEYGHIVRDGVHSSKTSSAAELEADAFAIDALSLKAPDRVAYYKKLRFLTIVWGLYQRPNTLATDKPITERIFDLYRCEVELLEIKEGSADIKPSRECQ